jgi:hypothetical protein
MSWLLRLGTAGSNECVTCSTHSMESRPGAGPQGSRPPACVQKQIEQPNPAELVTPVCSMTVGTMQMLPVCMELLDT